MTGFIHLSERRQTFVSLGVNHSGITVGFSVKKQTKES